MANQLHTVKWVTLSSYSELKKGILITSLNKIS